MRKWGEELEKLPLQNLLEVYIQGYRNVISISLNHEYIHLNSNLTVRLYYLNGARYNLFTIKNIECKN